MSDDKRNTVCTIDHANKQSDAVGFNPYEFWLKQADRLKAARQNPTADAFRRDQVNCKKS